ncbi:MAG TPA: hypothetical protein VGG75_13555 [Trebonia sp.]|jgi:hypothetical protein
MTTPVATPVVNDAMSMADLRKIAKQNGLTVTRGVTRVQLAEILTAKTPATTPPAKTPATTPPAKVSPVRTDVNPADVKPADKRAAAEAAAVAAAHTPEELAEITALENSAETLVFAGEDAAMKLADVIVRLYPLAPWEGKKLRNGHPMTLAAYYSGVIGVNNDTGFALPAKARQIVVKAMGNTVEVQVIADMTGAGARSVARDRKELGIASEARSAGGQASKAGTSDKTPASKTPAAPVTRMVPVLSMAAVAEFIADLDNTDMLSELSAAIVARMAELAVSE